MNLDRGVKVSQRCDRMPQAITTDEIVYRFRFFLRDCFAILLLFFWFEAFCGRCAKGDDGGSSSRFITLKEEAVTSTLLLASSRSSLRSSSKCRRSTSSADKKPNLTCAFSQSPAIIRSTQSASYACSITGAASVACRSSTNTSIRKLLISASFSTNLPG
jgi:hypothetical protein